MILYHGTDKYIDKIILNMGRSNTDFGQGFYTTKTNSFDMAKKWALLTYERRVADSEVLNFTYAGMPTVIELCLDDAMFEVQNINILQFDDVTEEWFEFVGVNRNTKNNLLQHKYDMVKGDIADDRVFRVFARYMDGLITLQQGIAELRAYKQGYQCSFHTAKAIEYLKITKYHVLKEGVWVEEQQGY